MSSRWVIVHGTSCRCSETVVTVKRSFEIPYGELNSFCRDLRQVSPFEYKRSDGSWISELVAHNVTYKLGFFTSRTVDTDLDEKESVIRRTCYAVIAKLYSWHLSFKYNVRRR